MNRVRAAARLISCAALAVACHEATGSDAGIAKSTGFRTPSRDASGACWDVGNARACYASEQRARLVERTIPSFPARSKRGWRCTGSGEQRTCRDRSEDAAEFHCTGDVCIQPHARVPDAHEWTCADAGGASLCLSKALASGVVSTPVDAGFICGSRRIQRSKSGERICIDLSPDFPNGQPHDWNCHFEHETGVTRVCRHQPSAALGDACEHSRPACPDGANCIEGHCLPQRAAPACWLDRDCESKTCRFGSCIAG